MGSVVFELDREQCRENGDETHALDDDAQEYEWHDTLRFFVLDEHSRYVAFEVHALHDVKHHEQRQHAEYLDDVYRDVRRQFHIYPLVSCVTLSAEIHRGAMM